MKLVNFVQSHEKIRLSTKFIRRKMQPEKGRKGLNDKN